MKKIITAFTILLTIVSLSFFFSCAKENKDTTLSDPDMAPVAIEGTTDASAPMVDMAPVDATPIAKDATPIAELEMSMLPLDATPIKK